MLYSDLTHPSSPVRQPTQVSLPSCRPMPLMQRLRPSTEGINMSEHWANDPARVLTVDERRRLHDLGHDPHPEQPEHATPTDGRSSDCRPSTAEV